MARKTIDVSKIKQPLQLKEPGFSNSQIAKVVKISRDKMNEYDSAEPVLKSRD